MRRRRNEDDWEPEGRGVGSDDGREAAGNCWRGLAGWEAYFGSHRSSDGEDGKKRIVERLQTFFAAAGRKFISGLEECTLSFPLNYTEFASECPLKGISRAIAEAPEDALSCIGLAVARSLEEDWIRRRGASVERKVSRENRIWPRLIGYGKVTKLKDLNSTTVGNFVTIQGNVVRVSNVRQQVFRHALALTSLFCFKACSPFPKAKRNIPRSSPPPKLYRSRRCCSCAENVGKSFCRSFRTSSISHHYPAQMRQNVAGDSFSQNVPLQ